MKVSIISPVKNEAPWIGYSVMAVLPYVHEIIYGVASSTDGTQELLHDLRKDLAGDKLQIHEDMRLDDGSKPFWDFSPLDLKAYNAAFNALIASATGDLVWFLHPDMIVTNPEKIAEIPEGPLAYYTNVTSFAGDFQTIITKGRCDKWKNIHAKKHGLLYFGGYGSQNEDFYHSEITGKSYRHYGTEFSKYPFEVQNSGININHYCELKEYSRRLEKMKLCLRTQNPGADEGWIHERAVHHPRVTLEPSGKIFGDFEFTPDSTVEVPEVITKYKDRFESYQKQSVNA